jgi:hypothetical protein
MTGHHTRNLIRGLTGAALCMALAACLGARVPEDLPAVALGQPGLYRFEVALFVFYGALLLITPVFSGLIRGHLPIEISMRGAKFAEEADQSTKWNEKKIEELKRASEDLTVGLQTVQIELQELKEATTCDNTPPTVGSET